MMLIEEIKLQINIIGLNWSIYWKLYENFAILLFISLSTPIIFLIISVAGDHHLEYIISYFLWLDNNYKSKLKKRFATVYIQIIFLQIYTLKY